MPKYTQEMQNQHSRGHEQRYKRPYLVVYEGETYVLGFPLTTKGKQPKSYPSHTNPIILMGGGGGNRSGSYDRPTSIYLQKRF